MAVTTPNALAAEVMLLLDMVEAGSLTSEQVVAVLMIDTGRWKRSPTSQLVGNAVDLVAKGELDVSALTAMVDSLPRATPRVQIVHSRDPDSECYLDAYLDGKRVDAEVEDIDPGRGYDRATWDERIVDARAVLEASDTPYNQAVVEALEVAADNKYIVDRFGD